MEQGTFKGIQEYLSDW